MWKAIFKNSTGGELDTVEAVTEEGLKLALIEKMAPDVTGWSIAKGDTIEIVANDD